jgi:hypothetical protein
MAMHPKGMGRYDASAIYTPLYYAFSNSEANYEYISTCVCVCVCVCVISIMAMHPKGMGRYYAPTRVILHEAC